jgi:hypothetical protein
MGAGIAFLSNREAKATFIAEYRRLNKVKSTSNPKERAKKNVVP